MVKKLFAFLLVALMLLPAAALADTQVIDDAGLFTTSEIAEMTRIINDIEDKHQVDIVILTTSDTPDDYSDSMYRVRDYADDYYDQHGYGMGPDDSGLLYLIDMNNRVQWISTGGVMREYIDDSREEDIFDATADYMRYGDYGKATIRAMEMVSYMMDKGREEGTFLYDEVTGERLSGIYNALTTGEMGVAAVCGVIVALVIVFSVSAGYNLKGNTYSYDLGKNSSLYMNRDKDHFLRETVTRTARVTSSGNGCSGGGGRSGGSGVHRSSGGVSHGGGGRRF